MARKRYKPEEIVAKLRQVGVLVSQGQKMVDAIRQIGVSEVARRVLKARILLKADVSEAGKGWSDNRIIEALETSPSMVYRVRKQRSLSGRRSQAPGRALRMALHSKTRQLAQSGRV